MISFFGYPTTSKDLAILGARLYPLLILHLDCSETALKQPVVSPPTKPIGPTDLWTSRFAPYDTH